MAELSYKLEQLKESIITLASDKALKVIEDALDGKIENEIQFQAAKEVMKFVMPSVQPNQTTAVTLQFANIDRPKELEAMQETKELEKPASSESSK